MLKYQAHIAGGHYAIESIPANTSTTIDVLASSYNGYMIKPERAHVVNNNNSGNVSVYVAGTIASTVPPFSAKDVAISGLISLVVENKGNSECKIVIVDRQMIEFAQDVYASLSVTATDSYNAIVNNFEIKDQSDIKNEGYLENVTYEFASGMKMSGLAKFGTRGLLNSIAPTAGNNYYGGSFKIKLAQPIDLAKDFTLSWYCKPDGQVSRVVVAMYNSANPTVSNSIIVTRSDTTTYRFQINNGTAPGVSTTDPTQMKEYLFVALCKSGNVLNLALQNTSSTAILNTVRVSNTLNVSTLNNIDTIEFSGTLLPGLTPSNYQSDEAGYDGICFTDNVALYTKLGIPVPESPPQ